MKHKEPAAYVNSAIDTTHAPGSQYTETRTEAATGRDVLENYVNRHEFFAYKEGFNDRLDSAFNQLMSEIRNLKWVFGIVLAVATIFLTIVFIVYPNMLNKEDSSRIDRLTNQLQTLESTTGKTVRDLSGKIDGLTPKKQ